VNVIEFLFSLSLFANAFLFLPQIIRLYRKKDSKDLSLLTFSGFALIQFLTICHGYINQDTRLLWGFLLSLAFCLTVCFLIIFYRYKGK